MKANDVKLDDILILHLHCEMLDSIETVQDVENALSKLNDISISILNILDTLTDKKMIALMKHQAAEERNDDGQ